MGVEFKWPEGEQEGIVATPMPETLAESPGEFSVTIAPGATYSGTIEVTPDPRLMWADGLIDGLMMNPSNAEKMKNPNYEKGFIFGGRLCWMLNAHSALNAGAAGADRLMTIENKIIELQGRTHGAIPGAVAMSPEETGFLRAFAAGMMGWSRNNHPYVSTYEHGFNYAEQLKGKMLTAAPDPTKLIVALEDRIENLRADLERTNRELQDVKQLAMIGSDETWGQF